MFAVKFYERKDSLIAEKAAYDLVYGSSNHYGPLFAETYFQEVQIGTKPALVLPVFEPVNSYEERRKALPQLRVLLATRRTTLPI